ILPSCYFRRAMKFKIFGDLDCPDWLLAEVFAMSKLSVVKLRLVCSALVKSLAASAASNDSSSLDNNAVLLATVAKHTSDAKFNERDNQALISALTQLFTSANKYSASPETLERSCNSWACRRSMRDRLLECTQTPVLL
ncbi:hypothetical protein BOX15_Mlig006829g3, partial [Macrostomum lignano]